MGFNGGDVTMAVAMAMLRAVALMAVGRGSAVQQWRWLG
ncbi:leucine-rich repeat extensin-like protein 3 [Iris pallida]|uniref:Leucine-rich repeat extensin-like protein 3 n=1 Tax=Iris pallida TaxID=29817 RepID=A0AAX6HYG7_IRIPA|nr:leucine-rich repeat extensin-like protein 3 [Iris pallida]